MALKDMPQTSKQHAVPQNIMDVEFKLIGDLTMRQFAYLMMFGGGAYASVVSVGGIFKWPVTLLLILFGLAFAFVPIQERGMDEWVVNFFRAVYLPTQRIWKKDIIVPSALLHQSIHMVKQELITLAPTSSRRKLEEYLDYGVTDVKEDPLDIPERDYILKVQKAFAGMAPAPTPEPSVGVTVLEPEQPQPTQQPHAPTPEEKKSEEPKEARRDSKKDKKAEQKEQKEQKHRIKKALRRQGTQAQQERIKKEKEARPTLEMPQREQTPKMTLDPITPDQHSGRRFVNLVPSEGELILPIRGEKVLRTSDEIAIEGDVRDKADKLKQLLTQIKTSSEFSQAGGARTMPPPAPDAPGKPKQSKPQKPSPQVVTKKVQPAQDKETISPDKLKTTEGVSKEAEKLVERLRKENEKLGKEIESLKQEISAATTQTDMRSKQELLKKLEAEKAKKDADYSALQQQIRDLRSKLGQGGAPSQDSAMQPVVTTPTQNKLHSLTSNPNVVSGVVKDATGKMLEGTLLILKNDKGEPVRAFKTNTLGQFMLSTSLANGMYTIEVSSSVGSELTFDIISVEAKGEVISPVELIGRRKEA